MSNMYYGPDGFGEQRGYPKVVRSSKQPQGEQLPHPLRAVSEDPTGVTYPA